MSFFYYDPSYFNTESYYENVGFGTADHERLRNVLFGISGKFMASYNDRLEIRSLYDGCEMYAYERLNSNRQISFFDEEDNYGNI